MKKIFKVLLMASLLLALMGCTSKGTNISNKKVINIAYQSSVGYAPLLIMKDQGLIEQAYGADIDVNWIEMKNGSEINEGLISGSLDVGTMGVPVAITGIMAGSPYRIAFGLSAQPYSIMTNKQGINSLNDFNDNDQIAITNINSQPHILLAMASKAELGDAHALDKNLVVLSNVDGYSAIVSGAVSGHMIISPYNFMEMDSTTADIHEITVSETVWNPQNTALVGVVSQNLVKDSYDVYLAVLEAMNQAVEYVQTHPTETSEVLSSSYDADKEDIQRWIEDSRSNYSTELIGVMDMANFMVEEGFIEAGPKTIEELVYEGVKGE